VEGTYECGNELTGSIKCRNFLISCKRVSFSRRTLLHGVSVCVCMCVCVCVCVYGVRGDAVV